MTHADDRLHSAAPSRSALTKLILLLCVTVLLAMPSSAQQGYLIQTGVPIGYSTLTLHVQGQPITVEEIVVSIYPMNLPPPWPAGLWLYTLVQADAGDGVNKSTWGQGQWCHWWFNEVAQLEADNSQQVPFPYLEVNWPVGVVQIQTDEGDLPPIFSPGIMRLSPWFLRPAGMA